MEGVDVKGARDALEGTAVEVLREMAGWGAEDLRQETHDDSQSSI